MAIVWLFAIRKVPLGRVTVIVMIVMVMMEDEVGLSCLLDDFHVVIVAVIQA